MNATDTKSLVRDWYGGVATGDGKCCGPNTAQETSSSMGYSEAELASLPEGADLGLGCGNPQALAAMRPGEVVVLAAAPALIASLPRGKSGLGVA
jgi:hypothetical protein